MKAQQLHTNRATCLGPKVKWGHPPPPPPPPLDNNSGELYAESAEKDATKFDPTLSLQRDR